MPGTFTRLFYHLVFSTKRRARLITPDLEPRLHEYMGGLVRAAGGASARVGGTENHVHLLVRWGTDEPLSVLLREVKARSSGWVHETFPLHRAFGWQAGYAAFTVSPAQTDAVVAYICGQHAHHHKQSFEEELLELLKRAGVEYDPRYLYD